MPVLDFKGKEFVYNHHLTVPYRPLEAHPDKSIGNQSDNLIILFWSTDTGHFQLRQFVNGFLHTQFSNFLTKLFEFSSLIF